MSARHVRPKGQPRRTFAPLDPDAPRTQPVFEPDPNPLSGKEAFALRNLFGSDLWTATRKSLGVSRALTQLAPRLDRVTRKRVAR